MQICFLQFTKTVLIANTHNYFIPNGILYTKRYIDDLFGVWDPLPDIEADNLAWANYQQNLDAYHGLCWDVFDRATTVNYLDITITITNGLINTDLYEKDLNLYLFIPPILHIHQASYQEWFLAAVIASSPYAHQLHNKNNIFPTSTTVCFNKGIAKMNSCLYSIAVLN